MNASTEMGPGARLANRPGRLSNEVAAAVTREIITGNLPAGSTLPPEPSLCATFGVSRPVIREAIKQVEQNGLVKVRQGNGTTVMPRSEWNLLDPDVLRITMETEKSPVLREDVVAMRANLEVAMLNRAAPKLTDGDFTEMERQLHIIDAAIDNDTLHDADREFHNVLYTASGNEIARTIVLLLIAETRSVSFLGTPGPDDYGVANKAHYRILELLRSGQVDAAATALHEHVSSQWIVNREGQS